MATRYEKVFTNPYPNGWENLPSVRTPIIAQALQQHTNAILSIENFLYLNEIPTRVSDLINDAIPTKVSELQNDLNYVTASQVPSKTSQLQNDMGYITLPQVPDRLSQYTNDVGFITNVVSNLLNYYLKTDTYSKSEVNNLLRNLQAFRVEVVNELPTTNISETTVYCVPKSMDNMVLMSDDVIDLTDNAHIDTQNNIDIGAPVTTESVEVEDPFDA